MLRFLKKHGKKFVRAGLLIAIVVAASTMMTSSVPAAEDNTNKLISVGISAGDGSDMASVLQMLLVLTVIALAPSILIMLTSFTRIVIVLHFTRTALGTQTIPPNQIIVGLSLFLTLFVMSPTFNEVYQSAVVPLSNNEISMQEAYETGIKIKGFEAGSIASEDDIPTEILIPAFIISELRIAFIIGFLIYLPFIVIDMVVSSTLMSMGMMMLPPTTISMPFKILLFVMADGWSLIIGNLMTTFK